MSYQECTFRGGPANGTKREMEDGVRTVSYAPDMPWPPVPVVPDKGAEPRPEPMRAIHTYARSAVTRTLFIYQGEDGKPKRAVPFTQYLMPDGRARAQEIEMPHDVADKADQLRKLGLVLEAEVLRTGEVSLTITDARKERDVDIRVVPNGPAVPEAVMDLVRSFNLEEYKR